MHHDPSDLGSLILAIQVIPKETDDLDQKLELASVIHLTEN